MNSILFRSYDEGMKLEGSIGGFPLVFLEDFSYCVCSILAMNYPPTTHSPHFCVGVIFDHYVCLKNTSLGIFCQPFFWDFFSASKVVRFA